VQPNSDVLPQMVYRVRGHLFAELPGYGLFDVFPAVIPQFAFEPVLHINYGEAVMSVKDGLPKFKDLPKDFGGSGEMLPE